MLTGNPLKWQSRAKYLYRQYHRGDIMTQGIYRITNKTTKHFYIGSSSEIETRWKKHIRNSYNINCKEYEYPICRAIRKYGVNDFIFEVLENTFTDDPAILIEREQFFYDTLHPEYNQMRPDFVPSFHPTEGQKKEISEKYKGEGNPFYGKTHTEETNKKLSELAKNKTGEKNPFYGKHHTEAVKQKLSEIQSKKVIATDTNGEEYFFNSAKEAGEWCRALGLTKSKTPNSDILKICKE